MYLIVLFVWFLLLVFPFVSFWNLSACLCMFFLLLDRSTGALHHPDWGVQGHNQWTLSIRERSIGGNPSPKQRPRFRTTKPRTSVRPASTHNAKARPTKPTFPPDEEMHNPAHPQLENELEKTFSLPPVTPPDLLFPPCPSREG